MELLGGIWLAQDGEPVLGDTRIRLLEEIERTGSITGAAKAVGLSYKTAWDAVDYMKSLLGLQLVESASGGKGGGGTRLTDTASKLVSTYRAMQREHERFLRNLGDSIEDFEHSYQLIRRLSMKSSARNQFFGTVSALTKGAVNSEVEVKLSGGETITAIITNDSRENLDLAVGCEVWALVKASWVILTSPEPGFKVSARNRLCGKVVRINRGAVNSDVVLEISGGDSVAAIVTNDSIAEMGLREGDMACATFKASSVILAVPA